MAGRGLVRRVNYQLLSLRLKPAQWVAAPRLPTIYGRDTTGEEFHMISIFLSFMVVFFVKRGEGISYMLIQKEFPQQHFVTIE